MKTAAVIWSLVAAVFTGGVAVYDVVAGRWTWALIMAALTGVNAWCLNRNLRDS